MEGISEVTKIPFEKIFFLNFMYEFSSMIPACTGIIVRNADGNIMHGRNLDFEFF